MVDTSKVLQRAISALEKSKRFREITEEVREAERIDKERVEKRRYIKTHALRHLTDEDIDRILKRRTVPKKGRSVEEVQSGSTAANKPIPITVVISGNDISANSLSVNSPKLVKFNLNGATAKGKSYFSTNSHKMQLPIRPPAVEEVSHSGRDRDVKSKYVNKPTDKTSSRKSPVLKSQPSPATSSQIIKSDDGWSSLTMPSATALKNRTIRKSNRSPSPARYEKLAKETHQGKVQREHRDREYNPKSPPTRAKPISSTKSDTNQQPLKHPQSFMNPTTASTNKRTHKSSARKSARANHTSASPSTPRKTTNMKPLSIDIESTNGSENFFYTFTEEEEGSIATMGNSKTETKIPFSPFDKASSVGKKNKKVGKLSPELTEQLSQVISNLQSMNVLGKDSQTIVPQQHQQRHTIQVEQGERSPIAANTLMEVIGKNDAQSKTNTEDFEEHKALMKELKSIKQATKAIEAKADNKAMSKMKANKAHQMKKIHEVVPGIPFVPHSPVAAAAVGSSQQQPLPPKILTFPPGIEPKIDMNYYFLEQIPNPKQKPSTGTLTVGYNRNGGSAKVNLEDRRKVNDFKKKM